MRVRSLTVNWLGVRFFIRGIQLRTMSSESDNVQKASPIVVPTTFGAEVTVPPGGTAEVTFTVDQDTLINGIEIYAERPAIVRISAGARPQPQTPTVGQAHSFGDYLERELPGHLARLVGEELANWDKRNLALHQAAVAGDDEAFFELLARDPRLFRSELALGRILTWRTWIAEYNRFFRLKLNRFFAEQQFIANAREQMERGQRNLSRLGASQLRPYDQRGKRPLPPTPHVRGVYYALLCLLQGLRTMYREQEKAGAPPAQIAARLSEFVDELTQVHPTVSVFLPWVLHAGVRLLRDAEVLGRAGFTAETLPELVGPKHATPSDVARELAAAAFEVSTDTVERLAAKPVAIPLRCTEEEQVLLAGPLTYDLLEFPEVKPLVSRLTR
jgi:hypothetical protein